MTTEPSPPPAGSFERTSDLGDKMSSDHVVSSWVVSSWTAEAGHEPWPSEALHKAAWEEPRAAIPLQRPLEPAVLMLLVHEDDITFL